MARFNQRVLGALQYAFLAIAIVGSVVFVAQYDSEDDTVDTHHGRGLGEEESSIPPAAMHLKVTQSVVLMTTVIVIFSVCMEMFVMDPLKEEEEENLVPIINTMFSELTLLGFVGLFMFIVEKLDLLSAPSYHIFQDKETLGELFEDCHMVVFLVMILFLLNAFMLLKMGRKTMKRWHHANMEVQGEGRQRIIEEYADYLRKGQKVPDELDFKLAFMAIRERFVMSAEREEAKRAAALDAKADSAGASKEATPEDIEKAKAAKKVVKQLATVPHDFDLSIYFGKIMGETSGEIVEVPVNTWLVLEVILCIIWVLQLPLDAFQFSLMFIGVGYVLMIMAYFIDRHLKAVMSELVPPIHYEKARRAAQAGPGKDVEMDAAVSAVDKSLQKPPFELRRFEDIRKSHGSVKKFFFGPVPNKHESLLFGGSSGEAVLTTCIRLESLGSAIYLAIFFVVMLGPIIDTLEDNTVMLAVVLLVAFIPVAVNFYALSVMISDFVVVTSVENMKNKKVIHAVKRAMVTKKAMTALKLLNTMRKSLPKVDADGKEKARKTPEETWPDADEFADKKMEMKEMFNLFDTSGDGSIDEEELENLLSTMNIGEDPAERKRIYEELDEDGEGGISFDEFFAWIAMHTDEEEATSMEELEKMSDQLFEMIDMEDEDGQKDGEITPHEFYETVSKLTKGNKEMEITLEDVEAMFKDVDEDGDGMLNKEEFLNMLKKFMFAE